MFSTKVPSAFAAALLGLVIAAPAYADVTATAGYLLTLGGVNVATAEVQLSDFAGRYDISLDAHVAGLAGLVASGTAKVESSGTDTATGLRSDSFHLLTRANGEDFDVKAQFTGGNVSAFVVTPPIVNNINRVPIERTQLSGVGDMVAAFILKGATLDARLCNRKMRIFTGIERFDLTMSDVGPDKATSLRTAYQGPVEQCRIRYIPISGHFTTSESTAYLARSDRIFVWYAPLADSGYFIPYRVLLATSVGDLSMVLTTLKH